MLVGFAADYEPRALARLGQRILWHVAPEVAEKADEAALRRQQERATTSRALTLSAVGDGRTRVSGWLDAEAAAIVNAALDPLCNPRTSDGQDTRTPTQRRADALTEVCALALRSSELPDHGGERPQLVNHHRPRAAAPAARGGPTGHRRGHPRRPRTPHRLRRLHHPRRPRRRRASTRPRPQRRLITGAVRRALVLRDGGCAFPACTRPARWCQGHHIVSWLDGGPTSLDNAVLLCGPHHRLVHHGDWHIRLGPDRRPDFIPPPHVDPQRRPRRNLYHRRP